MKLWLRRRWFTALTTISELFIDGVFECFILEDMRRAPGVKVPGQTCIPPGVYEVIINQSPKFGRLLPRIFNVKTADGRYLVQNEGITFEGVLIHTGTRPEHTEGCLLTGKVREENHLRESKVALDVLFSKLTLGAKPISLTITEEHTMPQTPTVGRVVHYRAHGSPNGQHKPADRAATVTEVKDNETVSLCVMNPTGFFFNLDCKLDESETPAGGTWHWPPRV